MPAATTNTSPRLPTRYKLRLADTCSDAPPCDFGLHDPDAAAPSREFAFEGSVHESHPYELALLCSKEMDFASANLTVNGEAPLPLRVKRIDAPAYDSAGASWHCCQLLVGEGSSRLFAMAYGFATLRLSLLTPEGTPVLLETNEIACMCDRQDQESVIAEILDELASDEPSTAIDWMLSPRQPDTGAGAALAQGDPLLDRSKSLVSYLRLCEDALAAYERNLPFFRSRPLGKLTGKPEVVGASSVRRFGREELDWLAKSPEAFHRVKGRTAFSFHGENFMPSRVRTERTRHDYDIFEHRAILSFAVELSKSLNAIVAELERQVGDLRRARERLATVKTGGGVFPAILVAEVCLKREMPLANRARALRKKALRIFRAYEKALPDVRTGRYRLPRRSKIFQEVVPYAELHFQMRRWDAFGDFEMLRDGLALRTWSMDKLYEYYVLFKLLGALSAAGFSPDENVGAPVRRVKYSPPDRRFENERQVANVYELARGTEKLTLFYEPVVYGYEHAEHGVDVFRTRKADPSRDSYWMPDYYIVHMDRGRMRRIVLDAKFRRVRAVAGEDAGGDAMSCFENCMFKYKLSMLAADGRPVDALWLVCGRATEPELAPFQDSSWAAAQSSFTPDGIATIAPGADESERLLELLGIQQALC